MGLAPSSEVKETVNINNSNELAGGNGNITSFQKQMEDIYHERSSRTMEILFALIVSGILIGLIVYIGFKRFKKWCESFRPSSSNLRPTMTNNELLLYAIQILERLHQMINDLNNQNMNRVAEEIKNATKEEINEFLNSYNC